MDSPRRNAIRTACGICVAAALPPLARARAQAPAYPRDIVTVIVPFAAGGSTDFLARLVATDLNARFSGKFVVDNRPGAGAIIGTRAVAGAAPDGRTLLYTTATPFSINPCIYQTLPYDPDNGFAAVALTVQLPLVVAVSAALGVRTMQELIDYLHRNEKHASYSSYGNGTASHISAALLVRKIGLSGVLHVPYQDTRAIPDLAAGRNTFHIDAWSTVAPWVSARKLLVLAGCGVEHMAWGPGVPTVASVIGQEFDMSTWHAVFAPKPTSSDILDLLNQEINATMAKDSVQQAAIALGFKPYPCLSRRDVAAFVATDRSRWKRFVEVAGVERQ